LAERVLFLTSVRQGPLCLLMGLTLLGLAFMAIGLFAPHAVHLF
jgi:hypothetical protein